MSQLPLPGQPPSVQRFRPARSAGYLLVGVIAAVLVAVVVQAIQSPAKEWREWRDTPALGWVALLGLGLLVVLLAWMALTDRVDRGPDWTGHSVFGRRPVRIRDADLVSITVSGGSVAAIRFTGRGGRTFVTAFILSDGRVLLSTYVELVRSRPISLDDGMRRRFRDLGVTDLGAD